MVSQKSRLQLKKEWLLEGQLLCELGTKQHPRPRDSNEDEPQTRIADRFGGARRDRTADLNTASVALSQLSYSPKSDKPRQRREVYR